MQVNASSESAAKSCPYKAVVRLLLSRTTIVQTACNCKVQQGCFNCLTLPSKLSSSIASPWTLVHPIRGSCNQIYLRDPRMGCTRVDGLAMEEESFDGKVLGNLLLPSPWCHSSPCASILMRFSPWLARERAPEKRSSRGHTRTRRREEPRAPERADRKCMS